MEYQITASIVIYKDSFEVFRKAIDSFLDTSLRVKLFIVDNSPAASPDIASDGRAVTYIFNPANLGFAAGHNIAIKKSLELSPYHLVLNPDVYFEKGTLEKLFDFMEKNRDVGLAMPKVLFPDGNIQYLCKLLPTPFDLISRRFLPAAGFLHKRKELYELRFADYNNQFDAPHLSGCFMFLRTQALKRVGLFDERFFLYLEDVDLSRRMHNLYRTVYCPQACIFHHYRKGSYRSWRLLGWHFASAIRYFNKWGYFFDRRRRDINKAALNRLLNQADKSNL